MVVTCCAVGCTERFKKGSNVRFYRFPAAELVRKRWVLATRRKDFEPTMHTRLCSKHFITGRPTRDPSHPDHVPSVFCFSGTQKKKRKRMHDIVGPEIRESQVAEWEEDSIPSADAVPTCLDCPLFKSLVKKMNLQIVSLQEESSKMVRPCLDCTFLKNEVQKMNLQIASLQEESRKMARPCLDCTLLKNEVQKMRLQIATLQEEGKEYMNTKELLKKMNLELNTLRTERDQYREQIRSPTKKIFSSKEKLFFYTGLNRPTIDWILEFAKENDQGYVQSLSLETQVLCVLMKLRLHLTFADMGFRFNTSRNTTLRVFDVWIPILGPKLLTLKIGKGDEIHFPAKLRKSVKDYLNKANLKKTKLKVPEEDLQRSDQGGYDSEETVSAGEELNEVDSAGRIPDLNIAGTSNDDSEEELAASDLAGKTNKGNSTNTFTNDEVEKSEATKLLEQIIKNGSTKELNNHTNIIYISDCIKNNESRGMKENNKKLRNNECVDSPKKVTNNGSEVYYIINTPQQIHNHDSEDQSSASNLPEDIIFLI